MLPRVGLMATNSVDYRWWARSGWPSVLSLVAQIGVKSRPEAIGPAGSAGCSHRRQARRPREDWKATVIVRIAGVVLLLAAFAARAEEPAVSSRLLGSWEAGEGDGRIVFEFRPEGRGAGREDGETLQFLWSVHGPEAVDEAGPPILEIRVQGRQMLSRLYFDGPDLLHMSEPQASLLSEFVGDYNSYTRAAPDAPSLLPPITVGEERAAFCGERPEVCAQFDRAVDATRFIEDGTVLARAKVELARALLEIGLRQEGFQTLVESVDANREQAGKYAGDLFLMDVVDLLAEHAFWPEAFQTARNLPLESVFGEPVGAAALRNVAVALAQAGYFADARSVIEEAVPRGPMRAGAYAGLGAALIRARGREAATNAIAMAASETAAIEDPAGRIRALVSIAETFAAAGVQEAARAALEEASAILLATPDLSNAGHAWMGVAAALVSVGFPDVAREVFERARASLTDGQAEDSQTSGLLALAEVQAEAGFWDAALETADTIPGQPDRIRALLHLARAQAAASLATEAKATLDEARRAALGLAANEGREDAMVGLVGGFADLRLWDDATAVLDELGGDGTAHYRARTALIEAWAEAGLVEQAADGASLIHGSSRDRALAWLAVVGGYAQDAVAAASP